MASRMAARSLITACSTWSVAIVGGGVAGASCANRLSELGLKVHLFDQGRQLGGRSSSRKKGNLRFDHGAQFFTANSPQMQRSVERWMAAGVVDEWRGRIGVLNAESGALSLRPSAPSTAHGYRNDLPTVGLFDVGTSGPLYVGTPSMSALCQHLANVPGVEIRQGISVQGAGFDGSSWSLRVCDVAGCWEMGGFDAVVFADSMTGREGSPGYVEVRGIDTSVSTQASCNLSNFQSMMRHAERVPLFSLMMVFDTPLRLPFDAVAVTGSKELSWIGVDSTKPDRECVTAGGQCLVAVTTPEFGAELLGDGSLPAGAPLPKQSPEYLEKRAARIWKILQTTLESVAESPLPHPKHLLAHRWGSAYLKGMAAGVPCFSEPAARWAACTDACLGPSIENAHLSGVAAADAVKGMLNCE